MSIIIGADIMPTKSNYKYFIDGEAEKLVGTKLYNHLLGADYRIINLETPLTDKLSPIIKCGPTHATPSKIVNGLKAMNINLITLANNHIGDQGTEGIASTINILDEAGISHVGGGMSLAEASKAFIFTSKGKKVGVYACAEHEFTIAAEDKAGANPFDPLESLDSIKQLKDECGYVIVLYHGGKEFYRYPSPLLQKICRKTIKKGADLVICQHSHCIGCMEEYETGMIIYGQGNFIFDDGDNEFVNTSLLVEINDDQEVNFIPLQKEKETIRLASESESKSIMDQFYARSIEIKDPDILGKYYTAFSDQKRLYYLQALNGEESFLFKALNRASFGRLRKFVLNQKYTKRSLLRIWNYIECEAHRELLLSGIDLLMK